MLWLVATLMLDYGMWFDSLFQMRAVHGSSFSCFCGICDDAICDTCLFSSTFSRSWLPSVFLVLRFSSRGRSGLVSLHLVFGFSLIVHPFPP